MNGIAQQQSPTAIRVLNLSSNTVTAFLINGLPFRRVGLDARPGESLTPAFADGRMSYEIHWRLSNGEVHGRTVELMRELPASFDGDVIISIHDDHLAVSWSKVEPAWIEHSRVGDPRKVPRPSLPYYEGCAGVVLENRLTAAAWNRVANDIRQEAADAHAAEIEIESNRCNLDWHIPRAAERPRINPDEETARRLEKEWRAQIDAYRARNPHLAGP